jgi:mRNA-degrading endonuclease RelE of RelBE toxin-antitoxin system
LKPCVIDRDASPTFRVLVDHWKKKFPKIEKDLDEAFECIRKDYRNAKQARSKPGFNDTVFKYRQKSSDMNRGASYGFRIYAYYDKASNTLYPIVVYPKKAMQEFDPDKLIKAVDEIIRVASRAFPGELEFPPEVTPGS